MQAKMAWFFQKMPFYFTFALVNISICTTTNVMKSCQMLCRIKPNVFLVPCFNLNVLQQAMKY